MKLPGWLLPLLAFLGGVAATLIAVFGGRRPTGPTPADTIVTNADAEKKRIADAIKADSDQALADLFNKLGGKP